VATSRICGSSRRWWKAAASPTRGAARYCGQQAAPPSVIATAAWRRGIGMRDSVGTRHRMRPAESEDIIYQGSRIAVAPSAHGRGGVQIARSRHGVAVLLARVAAGCSLLWSPLVAPSANAAMKTQRSQAAAASRPLGSRSRGVAHCSPAKRGGVELADSARSPAPTERPC
jgi:hypothetical protein